MYSSLKYEIKQQISDSVYSEQQFILARISVVDPITGEKASCKEKKNLLKRNY